MYRNEIHKKNQKLESAGKGPFLCIIVEDKTPRYGLAKSLDGTISISNLNIVNTKNYLRGLLGGNLIHSSSCPEEFFLQGTLLLHPKLLSQVCNYKFWDG